MRLRASSNPPSICDHGQTRPPLPHPMLSFTLDHIADIVLCLDEDAHIFYANHAATARLGHEDSELLTLTLYDIASHFSPETWVAFWTMLRTHQTFEMDSLLTSKQGEEIAANMSFNYIVQQGQMYCCVVIRDITARCQTEDALQQLNQELSNTIDKREQELQDSRTRLQNLADNIPGMIYQMCLDLNGGDHHQALTFTYASSGCIDVFGLFPEALQANSNLMFERVHPDDADRLRSSLLQSAQTLESWNWEGRFILPSGQIKWLQGGARPSCQFDRKVIWDGVFIDVSERKRHETERNQALASLVESEEKFRRLVEDANDIIYSVSLDGRFTYISPQVKDILGYEASELLGKPCTFIAYATEDNRILSTALKQIVQQGNQQTGIEFRGAQKQGGWCWLSANNSPIKNTTGHIIGCQGIVRDISVSKRREQAFQFIVESTTPRPHQTFYQSCAQFLAKALQMRAAVITELQESVSGESPRVRSLAVWKGGSFGPPVEYELMGTPCDIVFQMQKIYRAHHSVRQAFPKAELLSHINAESYLGIPILEPSGTMVGHIAVMDTRPILDDFSLQDYVLQIFATRLGIEMGRQQAESALQQSEMQLRQQTHQLENALRDVQHSHAQMLQSEKMSSLGQLVAGVAHEINNPVSFIYGNVRHANDYIQDLLNLVSLYRTHYPNPVASIQDLLEELDVDFVTEDLPKTLASMKVGAVRIKQIVKSLRNFSRMDEAEKKPVDIHEGLDSTVMILQNRLKAQSNRSEIKIYREYGDLPSVECYAGQLNQVFMNILSNAIDALEDAIALHQKQDGIHQDGTVLQNEPLFKPEIRIQTQIVTDEVKVHILDNGVGMPDQVRSRLFDPFFTTKPIGKGTGMGLSISYQIITEKHGGILECFSTPNHGTEFVITIPL